MNKINPQTAVSRIVDEFSVRGWSRHQDVSVDLVRIILASGGLVRKQRLSKALLSRFVAANGTGKAEVIDALECALQGCQVVPSSADIPAVHVSGNFAQINVGGGDMVRKKVEINNHGQFAGNVDSSGSQVVINNQQQALLASQERELRDHVQDAEIQGALALPLPDDEKACIVGKKLSKITGIAVDVATDFAAKLLAELVRPR